MKAYIVCGGEMGRAVIFGFSETEPVVGQPVRLERARMVLWWDAKCRGLLGLAANGPAGDTRLSPEVPATGCTVKEYILVGEQAATRIASWA